MKKLILVQSIFLLGLIGLFALYFLKPFSGAQQPGMLLSASSTEPLRMQTAVAAVPSAETSSTSVPLLSPGDFINPSTIVDKDKHFIINFKPLKDELTLIQKKQPQKTYIYFAYLNNSSVVGLNSSMPFTAASTIKVPLAMAIYRMEEQGKLKSGDSYTLDQLDLDPNFGTLYKAGADNSFTIDELVAIMLRYSDNTAMKALFKVMDLIGVKDPLAEVYNVMGWNYSDFGTNPSNYVQIDVKTLSNMFNALYNATYDNVIDSQKILSILSQTEFDGEIVAGVPKSVTVSHKIGVNEPDKTYSDCGIVYAPSRPYILCVGTTGASKDKADDFMKKISEAAYSYVINN